MTKHTKETLGFNSFSGYYASIVQGFGGFDWSDVNYMNATFWENQKTEWCDTGYQSVISGAGEAFVWNNNGLVSYGLFESANLKESFTLKSMVVASAWETNQPFTFISYTYGGKHKGFVFKASDTVYLSQTAQTINFAKLGNPGDFKNIGQVFIVSGNGQYGNTCSYGPYGYTTGNEMALDNMKVVWNGKIPKGNHQLVTTGLGTHGGGHAAHSPAAHLVSGNAHHDAGSAASTNATAHSGTQSGFHSELMSLGGSHTDNLTGQFQLPALDHFGT